MAAPKANGWGSSRRGDVDLSFAEWAQRIYLEPFVDTVLVEEVPAREQPEIIVVHIPRQADAANLPTKGRESVLHHAQEEIYIGVK